MNTIGSFNCTCYSGYELANDGKNCDGEYIELWFYIWKG